jgi:hypothetical protein
MNYFGLNYWTTQPHTNKYAQPKTFCDVRDVTVIHVTNAFYRNAIFSGTFLLNQNNIPQLAKAKERVEIYCWWFGARLKTRGLKIRVDLTNRNAYIEHNYSGKVVENLSV